MAERNSPPSWRGPATGLTRSISTAGSSGISPEEAALRRYDLLVAPVHLDPDHPLMKAITAPRITHHGAVRMLLSGKTPRPMVEVTGARGKTTTAHAIAHVARGGRRPPHLTGHLPVPREDPPLEEVHHPRLGRSGRTGSSRVSGWLVAEESLGVSGAGDVAVLTSGNDYRIAAGKRSALAAKLESMRDSPMVVVPPGVRFDHPHLVNTAECISWDGDRCSYDHNGILGEFRNPLGELPAYQAPLSLAAAALCALGTDPGALPASPAWRAGCPQELRDGILIVDNSNSGTSAETTEAAASYARAISTGGWITLVIGEEDRTVCEGFPPDAIASSIRKIHPDRLVLVGERGRNVRPEGFGRRVAYADTLEAARGLALRETPGGGAVVLAVKTWR